jgi:nucleoside 2-deoxyribosyltransferase
MAYTIFFSHNSDDIQWVKQIEHRLWQEGIKPYLFQTDPHPGKSVTKKIENAIRDSDALVVLVTELGQDSKWLNAEVGYAKAAEVPIIPLVDENIEKPVIPFIGDSEYIKVDLENLEDALPVLVKDLIKRKYKKYLIIASVLGGLGYLAYRDKRKHDYPE